MRLAVFTKNRMNPAYAGARLGAERVAERHGASVVHYVPKKADDVAEQIALIEDALTAKHDAFVFVPVHVTAMSDAIQRVLDAGIPVVNLINRLAAGKFVSFVGSDDYTIGLEVARYLARHLEGRGKVVIVEGMPGAPTGADRVRAFGDALRDFPGIEIVATLKGEYQQPAARAAMEAFLSSTPAPPAAVLAANDAMALGVLDALEARGLRIAVTGVNAVPGAIDAIKRGALLATADFDAMKIASIATEAAIRHLRGERVPAEIMLPTQVVDRTNFAAWDKPLEERAAPRWEDVVPGNSAT
jgi:ribose transport system substrate-binding protein